MMNLTFLKLEGIRGLSYAPRHIGEIEIDSFAWGEPIGNGAGRGAGGGPGRFAAKELILFKRRDNISPELVAAWTTGRGFASGTLTIETVTRTGSLLRTMTVHLDSVLISFISPVGGGNSHSGLEQIGLNVAAIRVKTD